MRTLDDVDFSNKTVLVQSNLDVPLHEGTITDDSRLQESTQTIHELIRKNCRVILVGHLGRPKGKKNPDLSLRIVAQHLKKILPYEITFLEELDGQAIRNTPQPGVVVLENIRMWPEEEAVDEEFAKRIATLADAFVNDDYIDAHRNGAVNNHLPKLLPSAVGRTLYKEYQLVQQAIHSPKRPLTIIIGGAKKDKIAVVESALEIADNVIVAGVLANTFLAALGTSVQNSTHDETQLEQARKLYASKKIHVPKDCLAAEEKKAGAKTITCYVQDIPEGYTIMDVGPQTLQEYKELLLTSGTIIWGGPVGVFEIPAFAHGTEEVAHTIGKSHAYSIVAGGDSGAALHSLGLEDCVGHISIGGGATLHLISGKRLPAIEVFNQ